MCPQPLRRNGIRRAAAEENLVNEPVDRKVVDDLIAAAKEALAFIRRLQIESPLSRCLAAAVAAAEAVSRQVAAS
jgi:hypothetical protein